MASAALKEESINTSVEEAKESQYVITEDNEIRLQTSKELDPYYSGIIMKLEEGLCETVLATTKKMQADHEKLVHSGFLASAAEYAALAAINEHFGMVYNVESYYYACARVGDEVRFQAVAKHMDTRKREVEVIGKIHSIKVYEAKIVIIIPEYHPLKIKLLEVAGVHD